MAIDFTTPSGQVRLLIADTAEGNEILTDPMIAGFLALAEDNDVRLAAALALESIAISETLTLKVMRTLDVDTDGAAVARALQTQAKQLRADVADGTSGGGDFDIADLVVDPHTACERLSAELLREFG